MKKLLSVIIPTYNEERDIGECLTSLLKQSYNTFEVIVVDDGSTDSTVKIVKNFIKNNKKIRLIKGQHKGPGFSRNLGAKKAKGDILVFVDADMTFDKNYIKNLVRPIFSGMTVGTGHGLEYAGNLDNVWSRCWGKIRVSPQEKEGVIFRAIEKKVFFDNGMFDPKYGYADDQTFFIKYGMKSVLIPNAICYHKNAETLREVYRQSKWIGASLPFKWGLLRIPVLNKMLLLGFYVLSPLIYPLITLLRIIKKKDFKLFFYYWPFMFIRYFGTLRGLFNWIIFNKNAR